MFQKSLIASLVLLMSSSVAFAAANFKGEASPAPMMYSNPFPVAPYVGITVGGRNNYANADSGTFKGIDGILSAGYGGLINQAFYLAGEIFALGTLQASNHANPGFSTKSTWGYGLSVLPGGLITDHLLGFARVGVIQTRFSDQGKSRFGGQLGLGLQAPVAPNWDIRAEYDYAFYRNITGIGTPRADQFNVGFLYKFL